jgi:pSer/pThr/pTyr-binding forkhead associated (FHA) protein
VSDLRLEVVAGPAAGARLSVDEPLDIGREAAGDGTLGADPQLSRQHARVSPFEGDRLLIEDLGSTNGTFVNGGQIGGPTVLGAGDTVNVGDTTLRVVASTERIAPDLALGGVHAVPTDLFGVLVSRAPVRREWVIRAALTALPIVLAVNFIIRTVAIEYFDVDSDIAVFKPHVLIIVSVMPVIGSSFGFYENFGRPSSHSPLRYLIPGFSITALITTIELVTLPADAGVPEFLATIAIALVAPSIVSPTMLGLRVRASLATEARLRGRAGS